MAAMRVNPTRMELTRLKRQLKTAVRGHKLLKDKRDEMLRQFTDFARRNYFLREKVERELEEALRSFVLASAVSSPQAIEEALMTPSREMTLEMGQKNVMSVDVPTLSVNISEAGGLPYSFITTSGDLDNAIVRMTDLMDKLIALAEMEKSASMLADEIEKTRRRVNALEHVVIPQTEETIRMITMKLDENERGNITRIMKLKNMKLKEN